VTDFLAGSVTCRWCVFDGHLQSNKYAVKAKDVEVPVVKRIHKLFEVG